MSYRVSHVPWSVRQVPYILEDMQELSLSWVVCRRFLHVMSIQYVHLSTTNSLCYLFMSCEKRNWWVLKHLHAVHLLGWSLLSSHWVVLTVPR